MSTSSPSSPTPELRLEPMAIACMDDVEKVFAAFQSEVLESVAQLIHPDAPIITDEIARVARKHFIEIFQLRDPAHRAELAQAILQKLSPPALPS